MCGRKQNLIIGDRGLTTKAAAEEIGQLDEESAAITTKAGLELPNEWIEAVAR